MRLPKQSRPIDRNGVKAQFSTDSGVNPSAYTCVDHETGYRYPSETPCPPGSSIWTPATMSPHNIYDRVHVPPQPGRWEGAAVSPPPSSPTGIGSHRVPANIANRIPVAGMQRVALPTRTTPPRSQGPTWQR